MKKHFIQITNDIYPFTVNVFINYTDPKEIIKKINIDCDETHRKVHKKINKLKFPTFDGYCFEKNGWIFIIVNEFNSSPLSYNTLHHEITHAVDFSAHFIGIKQKHRVREYSAYMHGFITNQIYKKIL